MVQNSTPHFHNDMGVEQIEIGVKEFKCVGARPPFDHPHVFLDMGKGNDIVCPYCSTLYVYNEKLANDMPIPADAVHNI